MAMAGAFDARALRRPIFGAPMAGGPSTPELAAAVTNAGGLGFVAAGYRTAGAFAEHLAAARALTSGAVGVNLFVPGPSTADPERIAAYRAELIADAERFGVDLGAARFDDDEWSAKLDVVYDLRPQVASFTFGSPDERTLHRLSQAGVTTAVTVTSLAEALIAADRGADLLIVQGPRAGGHRGTFDPTARPAERSLSNLLADIKGRLAIPLAAAGGLSTASSVSAAIMSGAVAAQVGTALLLATEAGTNPVHRRALTDPTLTQTAVTRAFSGRYARGLRNDFMRRHDHTAPSGYPEIHYLTSPLRAAAVAAGDPHGTNLWAGTGFAACAPGSAAEIVEQLAP